MKVFSLLAVSVALLVSATSASTCFSECSTRLLQKVEEDCKPWRDELPRPALYNHCKQGYRLGREAGCEAHCNTGSDMHRLDSLGIDACQDLRARPPSERMTACSEGFQKASKRAQEVVHARRLSEPEETKPVRADAEPKRKLSINSQTSSTKSMLEAAREEAVQAFQEAKGADL